MRMPKARPPRTSCVSSRKAAHARSSAPRDAGKTARGRTSIRSRRRSSWAGATSAKGVRRTRRHRAEGDPQGRARIIAAMRALAFVLLLLRILSTARPAQDDAVVARERKAGVLWLLRERPSEPVL